MSIYVHPSKENESYWSERHRPQRKDTQVDQNTTLVIKKKLWVLIEMGQVISSSIYIIGCHRLSLHVTCRGHFSFHVSRESLHLHCSYSPRWVSDQGFTLFLDLLRTILTAAKTSLPTSVHMNFDRQNNEPSLACSWSVLSDHQCSAFSLHLQ